MLSLASLRNPLTRTQALTHVTEIFTALGFDTTSWADGSIQKTFLMTLSLVVSDLSEVTSDIVAFGFNSYAKGVPLTEFSRSRFANERRAAVATKGPMTLTSTASIPYTIQVGQLIVATATGVQYRNTTGGTLSAGSVASPSTLSLTFEAVKRGQSGNAAGNNATLRMVTPLAGVTVKTANTTPWYTTSGADEESDSSLRARNSTKWATLTVEAVAETYEAIARELGATKVKVHDSNPRGPGTVDIYVAGDAALLGTSDMEAIQAAFAARTFQTDTDWPASSTSRAAAMQPDDAPLTVVATLYHDPNVDGATITTRASQALNDFIAATPLGGWDYSPGPANVVLREDIIEALQAVEGVVTVVLTTPSATVSVGTLELVTRDNASTLTPVAVP